MKAWSRAINGLLALLGIVVSLLVVEVVLRWIGYTYTPLRIQTIETWSEWRYFHAFQDGHFEYDPYLIWRPRKSVPPFNAHGYRGGEISLRKKPAEIRIFAIGDSNTLGWLGNGDFNWPESLQNILKQENPRFSVINAGVYGYSSFQGLRRLEEALPFEPDMVLVSFGTNDAMRVTVSDAAFLSRGIRALHLDEVLVRWRIGQTLLATYDRFASRQEKGLVPRVSIQEYRDNLMQMIALGKSKGIHVILLTRPFTGDSPDERWWKNFAPMYNATVLEVAKEAGIPVIDVYAYFAGKPKYFSDESHFTEAGHRSMARLIYERIRPLLLRRGQSGG
ncbi:MAG TPA: GDSL-type esterase/lipase family protein [Nitrospiraceae bacterium]|nr:GDSL-type esterase/lipase family protein [Nitrospiraceae bacterium]